MAKTATAHGENWRRMLQMLQTSIPFWTETAKSICALLVYLRSGFVIILCWWLRWLRICLQCGRPGFEPWVRKIPWRREWLPTPGYLPGRFQAQRSLVGYSPWGCKESDMTERLTCLGACLWDHTCSSFEGTMATSFIFRKTLKQKGCWDKDLGSWPFSLVLM